MKQMRFRLKRGVRRLGLVVTMSLVVGSSVGAMAVNPSSDDSTQPAWTAPSAVTLRRASDIPSVQHQPNFFYNLDCTSVTYRMVASSVMQTGCFTPTAFGMLDTSTGMGIFNGTDEAVPLIPAVAHQTLLPWPKALNILTVDPVNTGGDYVNMYKNPLDALQDNRNALGQLVSKQFRVGPELPLVDAAGRHLLVNPQSMAFSSNGSWLVAETLYGTFVRINLATLEAVAFAPAFGSSGSPATLNSEVAVSDDGRYVAIENKAAGSFQVYDLAKCPTPGVGTICPAHDYQSFVDSQIDGLRFIRGVRFLNDGLLSFEATTNSGASTGVYELAPTDSIASLTDYLGLGDSYTSGEGAFDYLDGTDTADNMCHLSTNSYPLLLTRDLFSAAGGHSVACSGAVINDVGSTGADYRGQAKGGLASAVSDFMPGYVAQQRFVSQYQPRVATVSIGGNDIGFGDILQTCVTPRPDHNTCYDSYEDRLEVMQLIDRTVPRWTALYQQLLAESPATRLYAIGYPQVAVATGNCALNVRLSKSEIEFSEELITYLDGAIGQAAAAAGVPYVDISQALVGHRLCETASYNVGVNGLTAGNDAGALGIKVLGRESYHPTALGQALIEQSILKQTHNLTLAESASNTSSNQALLNAPKTGRTINTLVPNSSMAGEILHRGASTTVNLSGVDSGLRPNTHYTIRFDGAIGPILTTLTTNETGVLTGQVAIPANTASGGHTLDVTGDNQAGDPVDIRQPVYVASAVDDVDGDGTADTKDTCPLTVNSGQDVDQDGIDDVCDGFIGSPAQNSGNDAESLKVTVTSMTAHFATSDQVDIVGKPGAGGPKPNSTRGATSAKRHQTQSVLGATSSRQSKQIGTLSNSRRKLPTIHWLRWILWPIICWLVLAIVMVRARRLAGRNNHTNEYR